MAKISLSLPPFSPDYSGAGAVLFDLNTVTAIHDGGGCNGNYAMHDEPRWFGSQKGIYSSLLREMDVILGDDEKLINKMCEASDDLNPDLIAIISSPVPDLIGSDMEGIALAIENKTHIPAIGIDTNGIDYYPIGAYKAAKKLIDKFAPKEIFQGDKSKTINIIGALTMDYGDGDDLQLLQKHLESLGYKINIVFPYGYNMDELKRINEAGVNLAISSFGVRVCTYLNKKYKTPFLVGFPVGISQLNRMDYLLDKLLTNDDFYTEKKEQFSLYEGPEEDASVATKVLILGDQVISNSIRYALREDYMSDSQISVGCIYDYISDLAEKQDSHLKSEKEIRSAMNDGYSLIIADPFFEPLINVLNRPNIKFVSFSQFATSGKLRLKDRGTIFGSNFEKVIS